MNQKLRPFQHYLALVGILALGTFLRFWNLDLKPLWLDEVITAVITLGHNYNEVPLSSVFGFSTVEQLFTLRSGVSCSDIAHTVATQSTHPPPLVTS